VIVVEVEVDCRSIEGRRDPDEQTANDPVWCLKIVVKSFDRVLVGSLVPSSYVKDVEMPTDDLWVTARIAESLMLHPDITDAVSSRLRQLLDGQFRERQLTQAELATVAKALIREMDPAPSHIEAKQ
jgi:hypothetical protein